VWCYRRFPSSCDVVPHHPAQPGRLLVVDWVPLRQDRTEGLMMLFKGGVLTAAQTARIRLPADELPSWAWCTEREASERLSELLARRTRAALRAKPKVQRPTDSQGEFDGADRRAQTGDPFSK
jgi:hypothetical protein